MTRAMGGRLASLCYRRCGQERRAVVSNLGLDWVRRRYYQCHRLKAEPYAGGQHGNGRPLPQVRFRQTLVSWPACSGTARTSRPLAALSGLTGCCRSGARTVTQLTKASPPRSRSANGRGDCVVSQQRRCRAMRGRARRSAHPLQRPDRSIVCRRPFRSDQGRPAAIRTASH